jgi:hypothetical protein
VAELDILTEPGPSRGLYGDEAFITGLYWHACRQWGASIQALAAPKLVTTEILWYHQRIAGLSGAAEVGNHLDYSDNDAASTASCVVAICRTRDIYKWLEVLPEKDEEHDAQQPPIQVNYLMTPL